MKSKQTLILLSFLPLLFSCSKKVTTLEDYKIEKGEIKLKEKIGKTSISCVAEAFSKIKISPDWVYSGTPVFFLDDCLFSQEEMLEFSKEFNYISTFDTKYKLDSTNYSTYTKQEKYTGSIITAALDESITGTISTHYFADLQEYRVTKLSKNKTFSVFGVNSDIVIDVLIEHQ